MERLGIVYWLKHYWWKLAGVFLVLYSVIAGLTIDVPDLPLVAQSIRNVFFHVCMWFSMIAVFFYAVVCSMRYLATAKEDDDIKALEAVHTGLFFGAAGIITGMLWAKFTWGSYWVNDPKLNGAAVSMLAYMAYLVLRQSVSGKALQARLAAVYNLFAFVLLVVFVIILPRVTDGSLHPGSAEETPFAVAKMQGNMYPVFLSAAAGWILTAFWIINIRVRTVLLKNQLK